MLGPKFTKKICWASLKSQANQTSQASQTNQPDEASQTSQAGRTSQVSKQIIQVELVKPV